MNLLPEKNIGNLHEILWKKNILWEKGDEITRFDGNGLQCVVGGGGDVW